MLEKGTRIRVELPGKEVRLGSMAAGGGASVCFESANQAKGATWSHVGHEGLKLCSVCSSPRRSGRPPPWCAATSGAAAAQWSSTAG